MIQTAVRLALQEDELPVTQLVLMNMISCDEPFHLLRNNTQESCFFHLAHHLIELPLPALLIGEGYRHSIEQKYP